MKEKLSLILKLILVIINFIKTFWEFLYFYLIAQFQSTIGNMGKYERSRYLFFQYILCELNVHRREPEILLYPWNRTRNPDKYFETNCETY